MIQYNTVGVDLWTTPVLHYSGKFWWARSEYIQELIEPNEYKDIGKYPNPLNSGRRNQEFWICSMGKNHRSVWNSGINCFERHLHRYTRDKYETK
jgi:hypothetical protein